MQSVIIHSKLPDRRLACWFNIILLIILHEFIPVSPLLIMRVENNEHSGIDQNLYTRCDCGLGEKTWVKSNDESTSTASPLYVDYLAVVQARIVYLLPLTTFKPVSLWNAFLPSMFSSRWGKSRVDKVSICTSFILLPVAEACFLQKCLRRKKCNNAIDSNIKIPNSDGIGNEPVEASLHASRYGMYNVYQPESQVF